MWTTVGDTGTGKGLPPGRWYVGWMAAVMTTRTASALLSLVVVVGLAGCGSGQPGSTATSSTAPSPTNSASAPLSAASSSRAIHVRYRSVASGGEAAGEKQVLDVITEGDRVRLTLVLNPADVVTQVWDGTALLVHETTESQDTRIEHPTSDQRPPTFIFRVPSPAFSQACPHARPTGTATVAGRAGSTFSCAAAGGLPAQKMTLDKATGLLLRDKGSGGSLVATSVVVGVVTDAATFSTALPASQSSQSPRPFTTTVSLPRVGGGTLQLADLQKGPLLVVIGDLAGARSMLKSVSAAAEGGVLPPTFVLLDAVPPPGWKGSLLNAADEKRLIAQVSAGAGTFTVPVGIDIKGAAAGELRTYEEMKAGRTVLVAIAPGGAVAWRATDLTLKASDRQLRQWLSDNK